jgi:GNAT superfamily N-acetyltransferase
MSPKVVIRQAAASDLAAVQRLNKELFRLSALHDPQLDEDWSTGKAGRDYLTRRIAGDGICIVAELDGELIGYLAGTLKKPLSYRPLRAAELENMLVAEAHRGRHVGRGLIEHFTTWCKTRQVSRVSVSAYAQNIDAVVFYELTGFRLYSVTLELPL